MNRVKPDSGWEHLLEIAKIEGLERAYTWNPARGCSGIGCEVYRRGRCWARMMAKRFGWSFKPHLIPERLEEPLRAKMPAVITPVSMGDLFGLRWEHINKILDVCNKANWHIFAVLTKLPQSIGNYSFAEHFWVGVTVNVQEDVWRLKTLKKVDAPKKYVLFEPLYGPIDFDLSFLNLIVIGPQNYPTVQPKMEWVESILKNAGNSRVFFKGRLEFKVGEA